MANKSVDVVEKNYITAKESLAMKGKLAFDWLIVLVTVTTHVFTARGEDIYIFFRKKENHHSIGIYVL